MRATDAGALRLGNGEHLPHDVLHQRPLVHAASCSSPSTRRDELVDRRRDGRRHRLAHPERGALDAEHDHAAGRSPERAAELERVGDPHRVRRRQAQVARQRAVLRLDAMERPGRRVAPQRVDHDHRVEPVPEVEQARRLVRAVEHGRARGAQPLCHDRADGVVAAERAPQADRRGPQRRSTSKRRKCVAHEMHGS